VHRLRICEKRLPRNTQTQPKGKAAKLILGSFFNNGLYKMYSSRNIVRVVKAMTMVSVGHVAGMREKINSNSFGLKDAPLNS